MTLKEIDRLISGFYAAALDFETKSFRSKALGILCEAAGAVGGLWLTRSQGARGGEFSEWPRASLLGADWMLELQRTQHGQDPAILQLPPPYAGEQGVLLQLAHRTSPLLTSVMLLRLDAPASSEQIDLLRRAAGHLVEASSLALQQVVQRDEWLRALGRPSRGSAALVDADGVLHAASARFRELVEEEFDQRQLSRLPFRLPLPPDGSQGVCTVGSLHLRVSRQDGLYLVHVRRPVPLDSLSPREQEIARALAEGKTFKTVARQLDIAVSTVANHASRIYRKLGIFRREELVSLIQASKVSSKAAA